MRKATTLALLATGLVALGCGAGSTDDAATSKAVKAVSPISPKNSACTTRPRSKNIAPRPEGNVTTSWPVLPPSAIAWVMSGSSITESDPRRP